MGEMGISPGVDEQQMLREIEGARKFAEDIVHVRYSKEDHERFSRIIKEFNGLYWQMAVQTWCNTKWRGVHVLKPPTDLWIYQELITTLEPDLIIETGTYYGGSALFMYDVMKANFLTGRIITIDITHERLVKKVRGVDYYLGSSTEKETIDYVKAMIVAYQPKKVMVILDSDHDEAHVRKELDLYAPLVSVGSALIVEDTNNHPGPKAAVDDWFAYHSTHFKKDLMCEKFMLTFNRDGYYERIKAHGS